MKPEIGCGVVQDVLGSWQHRLDGGGVVEEQPQPWVLLLQLAELRQKNRIHLLAVVVEEPHVELGLALQFAGIRGVRLA